MLKLSLNVFLFTLFFISQNLFSAGKAGNGGGIVVCAEDGALNQSIPKMKTKHYFFYDQLLADLELDVIFDRQGEGETLLGDETFDAKYTNNLDQILSQKQKKKLKRNKKLLTDEEAIEAVISFFRDHKDNDRLTGNHPNQIENYVRNNLPILRKALENKSSVVFNENEYQQITEIRNRFVDDYINSYSEQYSCWYFSVLANYIDKNHQVESAEAGMISESKLPKEMQKQLWIHEFAQILHFKGISDSIKSYIKTNGIRDDSKKPKMQDQATKEALFQSYIASFLRPQIRLY
ncbi:hypothetical protein N9N67_03085 [Bacteriovoracaceae bacterium]|nr:hypothetical protein [Bacteriovoracaceae bacterium]